MVHVAIVEDDDFWADTLQTYLRKFEMENGLEFKITRYRDGYMIVDPYPANMDIILMDIEMGLMDGMEAAQQIRRIDEAVDIIFVTNNPQYALQGYRVRALDYILKPIQYLPFSESMKRVLRMISSVKNKYLAIPSRNGTEKTPLSNILWIESMGHRLTFHLKEKTIETTVFSMKELESRLKDCGFARLSSGCLVNLRKVDSFSDKEIVIEGTRLPVSRGRKAEFMSLLVKTINE